VNSIYIVFLNDYFMFNITLFLIFVLYILSLGIGFRISKKNKDIHNKSYMKFKYILLVFILAIFLFSIVLSYQIYLELSFGVWILALNLCFILYFLSLVWFNTRCWKQHRMIFYNFFILILIYFSNLLFLNQKILVLAVMIYIYTVMEFSFAKFKIGFEKIWD
jgi:hypothetical protein